MKSVMIVNPEAGSADGFDDVETFVGQTNAIEVWRTQSRGHATRLAQEAVSQGAETVIAAGGDGTIHEVVNGIAESFPRVKLGVLPLGTGNDLCRTLGVSLDPEEALAVIRGGKERRVDVIAIDLQSEERRFAVNHVAGGFSAKVSEALTTELKQKYGPFAFLIGVGDALTEIVSYDTEIRVNGQTIETDLTLGVLVANGRTVAGGFEIAPRANPDDGLLNITIVAYRNAADLAALVGQILAGEVRDSESVSQYRAGSLRIASTPAMPFSADGELLPSAPDKIFVMPGALRVLSQ